MKKFILQALVLFVTGAAIGVFYNAVSRSGIALLAAEDKTVEGYRILTTEEIQLYLKEGKRIILVDSRSPEEFELGHIPGAINIPEGEVDRYYEKNKQKLKSADMVVVYCSGGSCGTSEEVAKELILKGVSTSKMAVDQDGLPGWIRAKKPIETGAGK